MRLLEDGSITVRQSWLSDFLMDPERARLAVLAKELDRDTDVSVLGTSVHEAIELYLGEQIEMDEMVPYARHRAQEVADEGGFVWMDLNPKLFVDHAGYLTRAWIEDLSFYVPRGGESEKKFKLYVCDIRHPLTGVVHPLYVTGTIDYVPPDVNTYGLWDWKTSSRKYDQWKKQRWAIQPSIYAWASVNGMLEGIEFPVDFYYGVMVRQDRSANKSKYAVPAFGQRVHVRRFASHGEWVMKQAVDAVDFVLRNGYDKAWPQNDGHELCSEKWCPWWSMCKGSTVTNVELTWKP